ncbi:hypothetical protein IMSAG192_01077 [Muribaculaceae bacterium]|nr:hypothetical protein IMSAG192_01077 [Muribaculaceae bacterium]
MKLTRSLPANAMARENVPMSTTTFSTLTLSAWSSCIIRVQATKEHPSMAAVWSLMYCRASGVIHDMSFTPLRSMKYMIAVVAKPPYMPIFHFRRLLYSKENMARVINCTMVPNTNAMATDKNIPSITDRAFSVLRRSISDNAESSPHIFIRAITNAAPSSSNTIDTVVDVGMPRELNMSRSMMSVTITAMNMHMRS